MDFLLRSAGTVLIGILVWIGWYLFRVPSRTAANIQYKAPPFREDALSVYGALKFFYARWDFFNDHRSGSTSRNFTFFIKNEPVIALIGEDSRVSYFEDRRLDSQEGYSLLFGKTPGVDPRSDEGLLFVDKDAEDLYDTAGFSRFFHRSITKLLKPEALALGLPDLLRYTAEAMQQITSEASTLLDPFHTLYQAIFRLTVRTIGCKDISDDPNMLQDMLSSYDIIENSFTPASILAPWWFVTPNRVRRLYGGFRLYLLLNKVVNKRIQGGLKIHDPLQTLLDQQASVADMTKFMLAGTYAGLVNTSIAIGYLVCFLSKNRDWLETVRHECGTAATKHKQTGTETLPDSLRNIPLHAWTTEFPMMELCLRETIRFTLVGASFRKNISDTPVPIGNSGQTIPPGWFATYHSSDVHQDPSIYSNPSDWDPARYLTPRSEHQNQRVGYMGWGHGPHACMGKQFALLELTMMAAYFVASFDFELCDEHGASMESIPRPFANSIAAERPRKPVRLRLRQRKGEGNDT